MKRRLIYFQNAFFPIFIALFLLSQKFIKKQEPFLFIPKGKFNFTKCQLFRSILNLPDISCKNLCIKNHIFGRFGNHLIELLRLYQFAKATGLKKVYVPFDFLLLNESFKYKGITYEMPSKKKKYGDFYPECISHKFYYPLKALPRIPFEIDHNFRDWFLKKFPVYNFSKNTLVMHIRAGDAFHGRINKFYGQPPCNYYQDIIDNFNSSKLILVAEDNGNPCLSVLRKHNKNAIYHKNDVIIDFGIMLSAKNLVVSKGSLGFAMILLSKKVKKLFTFNVSSSRLMDHWNCVPSDDYYEKVLRIWKYTRSQKKMLLNSSCLKWEYITHGPKNYEIYIHEDSL